MLGNEEARGALNPGALTREKEDLNYFGFRRFFRKGFKEFLKHRYGLQIGELIGEGSFGAVYDVLNLPRSCVKLVHLDLDDDGSKIDEFEKEVDIAQRASGFGPEYITSFVHPVAGRRREWIGAIVMEKMEGDCLQLIKSKKEDTLDALANAINAQVPTLLQRMVEANIMCMDLKLANLFYRWQEGSLQLKMGDFGIWCGSPPDDDDVDEGKKEAKRKAIRLAMGLMFYENVRDNLSPRQVLKTMLSELTTDLSKNLTEDFLEDFARVHSHYTGREQSDDDKEYFDDLVSEYIDSQKERGPSENPVKATPHPKRLRITVSDRSSGATTVSDKSTDEVSVIEISDSSSSEG